METVPTRTKILAVMFAALAVATVFVASAVDHWWPLFLIPFLQLGTLVVIARADKTTAEGSAEATRE